MKLRRKMGVCVAVVGAVAAGALMAQATVVTVQGASTLRTPVVLKGQSTSLQFTYEGTYGYICGLHPAMKGEIVVTK